MTDCYQWKKLFFRRGNIFPAFIFPLEQLAAFLNDIGRFKAFYAGIDFGVAEKTGENIPIFYYNGSDRFFGCRSPIRWELPSAVASRHVASSVLDFSLCFFFGQSADSECDQNNNCYNSISHFPFFTHISSLLFEHYFFMSTFIIKENIICQVFLWKYQQN